MLSGGKFSKHFLFNSKNFKQNLKKTKKIFKFFYSDFKNFDIPLLQSYGKNYNLDFSQEMVKKFSRYSNIIIMMLIINHISTFFNSCLIFYRQ